MTNVHIKLHMNLTIASKLKLIEHVNKKNDCYINSVNFFLNKQKTFSLLLGFCVVSELKKYTKKEERKILGGFQRESYKNY